MDTIDLDRRAERRPDSAARRTRLRLRELCDEVLTSYRLAKGSAPISDAERAEAEVLLSRVAPPTKR